MLSPTEVELDCLAFFSNNAPVAPPMAAPSPAPIAMPGAAVIPPAKNPKMPPAMPPIAVPIKAPIAVGENHRQIADDTPFMRPSPM